MLNLKSSVFLLAAVPNFDSVDTRTLSRFMSP